MGRHEDAMAMWRVSYAGDPEALEALVQGGYPVLTTSTRASTSSSVL